MLKSGKFTQVYIVDYFNVSEGAINDINKNRTWKNVK
jgi:hypothetical protein